MKDNYTVIDLRTMILLGRLSNYPSNIHIQDRTVAEALTFQ